MEGPVSGTISPRAQATMKRLLKSLIFDTGALVVLGGMLCSQSDESVASITVGS